jgi:hypothetical protein
MTERDYIDGRPLSLSAINRNLQSVLRWSCLALDERLEAEGILLDIFRLKHADIAPLVQIGKADYQRDVMTNLRAARERTSKPTHMWPTLRERVRLDLAAFLENGLRNWDVTVTAPGVSDESKRIVQRRIEVSRSQLQTFATTLKLRGTA